MIDSENIAKEQYKKIQDLIDENAQLKRIHGSQEALLDSSQEQKLKREDIRQLKEEIQQLNTQLRASEKRQREREKKIKERHNDVIEH